MSTHLIKAEAQSRIEAMLDKLKSRDFRLTPQRYAIVRILASSEDHPSVSDIYVAVQAEFPTTSLATVYKTVGLLKELDEVLELGFHDGNNRYDGNRPAPHPHVICNQCGKIMDPELASIESLSTEMSLMTGYKIISHRLDFFGLCPDCQKQE